MSIADYFAAPDAKRILLMEIQRTDASATCYRISDEPYVTEPSDTPASCAYSPIIGGGGLPEFRRVINDVFDGGASTGFGSVTLASTSAAYTTSGAQGSGVMTLPRGTAITVKVAAPRALWPYSDAITLAVGKVNRVGGSSDGDLSVEIIDGSANIAAQQIAVVAATAPLCFGYCRNVTPFLTNPATLKYTVHDSAVNDITAVYDDGVLLTLGTDYTKTPASGYFNLVASPAGVITADVQGAKVSGTWLQSTQAIVGHLLDRAGVTAYTRNFVSLPTGTIGLYLTATDTLGSLLTRIMQGCAGYWYLDRAGALSFAQYPLPASGGAVYDEKALIDKVAVDESDRLYKTVQYQYRTNWTTQSQVRPAATAGQAAFAASAGLLGNTTQSTVAEYTYTDSPLLTTLFDSGTDAAAAATKLQTLYGTPRKLITATVPYTATLKLGDPITLSWFGTSYDGAVIALADVFNGAYPQQKITVVA